MIVSASQHLVFGRKFDNSLKSSCKACAVAEAVLEHENEEIERKTAQGLMAEKEESAGEPCELELLRKPPQQRSEGSESYWKAVAITKR